MYSLTEHVRKDGKAEVLNLVYEPEVFDDTDDELMTETESETDAGEVPDNDEFSGFVVPLDPIKEARNYRRLNAVMKRDRWPVPSRRDIR